eukprot:TRINITY_DN2501_c0_g4_i1.p1 TRINITY_DN2501_c0_g4~~TRINITY_DN2501_c0_g4_i1.p1  ORF type:complete len:307 (-),score=44.91 TRINITY_DN2501_c0_g4_i1:72-992(-)
MANRRNVSVLEKRFKMALENESYYEALQLCQTIAFRHTDEGNLSAATEALIQGAEKLLEVGETVSAAELLSQLFDLYKKSGRSPDDPDIQGVMRRFEENFPSGQGRVQYLTAMVKFSTKDGKMEATGDQILALAEAHARAGDYGSAQRMYMKVVSVNSLGAMILKWIDTCPSTETDLLMCRPVLQYLARGLLEEAKDLHRYFVAHAAPEKLPNTPLIHCVALLFKALDRKSAPYFKMLKSTYAPSIQRDPTFPAIIDAIYTRFFAPAPTHGGGFPNIFGDLMRNLMGGDDHDMEMPSSSVNIEPLD